MSCSSDAIYVLLRFQSRRKATQSRRNKNGIAVMEKQTKTTVCIKRKKGKLKENGVVALK